MAGSLIPVTTGAGGLAAALGTAGLYWSLRVGYVLDPTSIALLVVGVVLLTLGFTARFEHHSRLWVNQMEAQTQARRRELQSLGIIPRRSPQVH